MKRNTGELLTHEVIKTARTFYRSQNLEVRVGGEDAKTDGKTVWLPTIPHNVEFTREEIAVIRGFVDHEAGHGRHTTFSAITRQPWRDLNKRFAHFMPIANGLEDVRIEKQITGEYPGSQSNLEQTSAWANRLYLNHYASDPTVAHDIAKVGAVAITWAGRKLLGYNDPTLDECLDTLPADIRRKVEKAAKKAFTSHKRTTDCMKHSKQLLSEWGLDYDREEAEEQRQQEQERRSNMTQEERDAEDAEREAQQAKAADTSDEQGEEGDDPTETRSYGLDSADKPDDAYDPNLDKVMQNIVQKTSVGGAYSPRGQSYDTHWTPVGITGANSKVRSHVHDEVQEAIRRAELRSTFDKIRDDMRGYTNRMRKHLDRALLSTQDRTWRGGYEEGALNPRALVRGLSGAMDIFRKRDDAVDLDTCVMMILDQSASMRGAPARMTVQTAIALSEIFEKVDIPFAVASFDTLAHDKASRYQDYEGNEHPRTYGRNHAVSTYLLKTFEERLRTARHRVAAYIGMVGQSANTDGDCIQSLVLEHLRPRTEKRKIVFVFSDGEPCGDFQEQRLKEVVKNLSDDYEIIGFGMESCVSDYYPNNVSVYDMDTLVGKVAKQVGQMLLGKKFKEPKHETTQS